MLNFIAGLALGLLGATVFLAARAVTLLSAEPDCSQTLYCEPVVGSLALLGLFTMVGAPLLFWLLVPLANWLNRHLPARFRHQPPPDQP